MAKSKNYKSIIALGEKLVQELELSSTVDTLGRWMTHHVAQLIHDAESLDKQPDKSVAEDRCRAAILELWTHIAVSALGPKLLDDVEPIVQTLNSLNPDHSAHYFYQNAQNAVDSSDLTEEAKSWLTISRGLDYTARLLIKFCLAKAAEETRNKNSEWIKLAEDAFNVEYPVIRIITAAASDAPDAVDLAEEEKNEKLAQLEERLDRLRGFKELAEKMETEISSQITTLNR